MRFKAARKPFGAWWFLDAQAGDPLRMRFRSGHKPSGNWWFLEPQGGGTPWGCSSGRSLNPKETGGFWIPRGGGYSRGMQFRSDRKTKGNWWVLKNQGGYPLGMQFRSEHNPKGNLWCLEPQEWVTS